VTPFTITTPDGETLYAWHVLPLDTCIRNAKALVETELPSDPVEDFTKTLPFELLASTSTPARVIINCEHALGTALPQNITNGATAKKSMATLVTSLKAGEQTHTATWLCNPIPTS
jgi:hypothetical protein